MERPKFAPQVDDVGRVRNIAQQGRIFGVGRGDGPDAVAAAVEQLALGGGEALALEDGPQRLGTQPCSAGQLVVRGGEDAAGVAEHLEQVCGALHTDAGGHLQGDVFECHGRGDSFAGDKGSDFRAKTDGLEAENA